MTEWVVLNLDAKQAKQHGMPEKVPMPKDQFEAVGIKGLTHDSAQKWIAEFLGAAGPSLRQKEPATAKRYEAYLAKFKFWQDAQKAFTRRDFSKATSLLQLVCNVDKEDYAAKQNLATAHAAQGNHDAARKLFTEIAEVWQGSADYHVAFGNTLLAAGAKDEATEQFVLALEADAECRPALDGLVALGWLVKVYEDPLDPRSLTFVRRDALLDYLNSAWDQSLAAHPQPVDFLLRVGAYHESEQRYDVALAAAERILGSSVGHVETEALHGAVLLKASALRHLKRAAEAASVLREHVSAHPRATSALAQLAAAAFEDGDTDAGKRWVGQALAVDPGHLTALQLEFFRTLDAPPLERVEEALAAVEAYAATHPESPGPQRLLGRLWQQVNNEEKCLGAFRAAVEPAPADDDVLAEYLDALLRFGRFQSVVDTLAPLSDLAHRDWRLRWSEADAYLGLGKKMEARAAFTALNADESVHVAVRARAKRAVQSLAT